MAEKDERSEATRNADGEADSVASASEDAAAVQQPDVEAVAEAEAGGEEPELSIEGA